MKYFAFLGEVTFLREACSHGPVDATPGSCSNELHVRSLTAILLFAATLLPFVLPAFTLGQDPDTGMPACCRRHGAHHCMMSMSERDRSPRGAAATSQGARWHAPAERCPCCPASAPSLHAQTLFAPTGPTFSEVFFGHPLGLAQTECRRRLARDRSRQKRGPPLVSLA